MTKRKNPHLKRATKRTPPQPWVDPPVLAASETAKAELERRGVTNIEVVDPRQLQLELGEGWAPEREHSHG
jgi:hypothetical protein